MSGAAASRDSGYESGLRPILRRVSVPGHYSVSRSWHWPAGSGRFKAPLPGPLSGYGIRSGSGYKSGETRFGGIGHVQLAVDVKYDHALAFLGTSNALRALAWTAAIRGLIAAEAPERSGRFRWREGTLAHGGWARQFGFAGLAVLRGRLGFAAFSQQRASSARPSCGGRAASQGRESGTLVTLASKVSRSRHTDEGQTPGPRRVRLTGCASGAVLCRCLACSCGQEAGGS